MKKLILLALTAAVLLTAAAFLRAPHANTDDRGQDVVMLNEIAQLAEAGQNAEVIEKAAEMQNMIRQRSALRSNG